MVCFTYITTLERRTTMNDVLSIEATVANVLEAHDQASDNPVLIHMAVALTNRENAVRENINTQLDTLGYNTNSPTGLRSVLDSNLVAYTMDVPVTKKPRTLNSQDDYYGAEIGTYIYPVLGAGTGPGYTRVLGGWERDGDGMKISAVDLAGITREVGSPASAARPSDPPPWQVGHAVQSEQEYQSLPAWTLLETTGDPDDDFLIKDHDGTFRNVNKAGALSGGVSKFTADGLDGTISTIVRFNFALTGVAAEPIVEPPEGSIVAVGRNVYVRDEDDDNGAVWYLAGEPNATIHGWRDVAQGADVDIIRRGGWQR